MSETFDPAKHLTKVSGGDYLEVRWRLVWWRSEHPEGVLSTQDITIDDKSAVFRATVGHRCYLNDEPLWAEASGYGSETRADFGDFIEKAETKAIGRALAAAGYGTQFSLDFSDAPSGRIADSPIDRERTSSSGGGGQPATDKQIRFLNTIARSNGWREDEIDTFTRENYGVIPEELTKADASQFIEFLQSGGKPPSGLDTPPSAPQTITRARVNQILTAGREHGWTDAEMHQLMVDKFAVNRSLDLTPEQADALEQSIVTVQAVDEMERQEVEQS